MKQASEYLEKAVKAKEDDSKVLYQREYLEALYHWAMYERQGYAVQVWSPNTKLIADNLYIECGTNYLTYESLARMAICLKEP